MIGPSISRIDIYIIAENSLEIRIVKTLAFLFVCNFYPAAGEVNKLAMKAERDQYRFER